MQPFSGQVIQQKQQRVYTIDQLWGFTQTSPHYVTDEKTEIIEFFNTRWSQLLQQGWFADAQPPSYDANTLFTVSFESSQLLQIFYDAFSWVAGEDFAGRVLLEEYSRSALELASLAPNIEAYQAQIGGLFQDITSPMGIAIVDSAFSLCNRWIRAFASNLKDETSVQVVGDLEGTTAIERKENFHRIESQTFGPVGERQHSMLCSEPWKYDPSPYGS